MEYFERGGNTALLHNIASALSDPKVMNAATEDFSTTFRNIGISDDVPKILATTVINELASYKGSDMAGIEEQIDKIFAGFDVISKIKDKIEDRRDRIITQLAPHLVGIHGKVIDFGAGSGLVAQGLHDKLGIDIEAVDVRDFKSPGVAVKFHRFDGNEVPVHSKYYEAAVLTNVIHHEENNEKILKELDRIVSKKLVIIETMAARDTKEEWQRTFLNDVLWNRFFNHADIPVPGTYENVDGWVRRFGGYGWRCTNSIDLGYDQPTITDIHHLFVFEK